MIFMHFSNESLISGVQYFWRITSPRKFTISSYASHATQLYLMRNKRPGLWHPDFKPLFQAVRESCLGGLCMVARHDCSEGSSPLNDHLKTEDAVPKSGNNIIYADENSLYGSSVSTKNLFSKKLIVVLAHVPILLKHLVVCPPKGFPPLLQRDGLQEPHRVRETHGRKGEGPSQ